jgi:hypothetical protein
MPAQCSTAWRYQLNASEIQHKSVKTLNASLMQHKSVKAGSVLVNCGTSRRRQHRLAESSESSIIRRQKSRQKYFQVSGKQQSNRSATAIQAVKSIAFHGSESQQKQLNVAQVGRAIQVGRIIFHGSESS